MKTFNTDDVVNSFNKLTLEEQLFKTIEHYKKRNDFIIKYMEERILIIEKNKKDPKSLGMRAAYKDILYKLKNNSLL